MKQLELQGAPYGIVPEFKRKVDFVDYFKMKVDQRLNSGVNYQTWRSTLKHLEGFCGQKSIPIGQVDVKWLEEFRSYLGLRLAQNSAHTYFNKVKRVIHEANRDKIIPDDPALRVKSPEKVETTKEFLTIEELRILAKTDCRTPELKKAFLFSCFTSLRWGNIPTLKWGDFRQDKIDEENTWVLRYLEDKNQQNRPKIIEIPVKNEMMEILGEFGYPDELVFNLRTYGDWITKELTRWMMRAGITKYITYHCSRTTFFTLSNLYGQDLFTSSRLGGHRSVKTTQGYTHPVDEQKLRVIKSVPDLEG